MLAKKINRAISTS